MRQTSFRQLYHSGASRGLAAEDDLLNRSENPPDRTDNQAISRSAFAARFYPETASEQSADDKFIGSAFETLNLALDSPKLTGLQSSLVPGESQHPIDQVG